VPNVSEGIEVEGQTPNPGDLSDAEFARMIEQSPDKRWADYAEGEPRKTETADPSLQSADQIQASLLANESADRSIPSGISVERPQSHEWTPDQLSDDDRALIQRSRQQLDAEQTELADYRHEIEMGRALGALEDADDLTRAALVGRMDEDALAEALEAGLIDRSDMERSVELLRIGLEDTQRKLAREEFAENALQGQQVIQQWAKETGVTVEEAGRRLAAADRRMQETNDGYGLAEMLASDPESAAVHLRVTDSVMQELDREERLSRFHNRFFQDDRDVGSGLTVNNGFGHVPMRDVPSFEPNEARAIMRATLKTERRLDGHKPRVLPEDIRAGVSAPDSRDIRSGLTKKTENGWTPADLDDVSGGRRRHEQSEEDKRRRAWSVG
jgi:hypothetical protein